MLVILDAKTLKAICDFKDRSNGGVYPIDCPFLTIKHIHMCN